MPRSFCLLVTVALLLSNAVAAQTPDDAPAPWLDTMASVEPPPHLATARAAADPYGEVFASGGLTDPRDLTFGPDGHLYVADIEEDAVLRYDGTTGAFVDAFVPPESGGLDNPYGLTFGPDGHLYVVSIDTEEVLRYDGATGAFIDAFAARAGLDRDVVFGPDGDLFASSLSTDQVFRFDGTTGAFTDVFVSAGSGGLTAPIGLAFGPDDGHLYVASGTNQILRYDGTSGAFIDEVRFASSRLNRPIDMTFGPDGFLYVASFGSDTIVRLNGISLPTFFVTRENTQQPTHLAFDAAGNLYATAQSQPQVTRYAGRVPAEELAVLGLVYATTDGPNWRTATHWLSEQPTYMWHGVTMRDGRVRELRLPRNDLRGSFPTAVTALPEAWVIDFSSNQLTGSIPPELGSMPSLLSLSLSDNQLSGAIPPELGQSTSLGGLSLANNQLSGAIPPELGDAINLQNLFLSGNQLTGPLLVSFERPARLGSLEVADNQLSGPIPDGIDALTNLSRLNLGGNQFSGTVPDALGALTQLTRLGLDRNRFTGAVPAALRDLTALTNVRLNDNQFTGLPDLTGALTELEAFEVQNNRLTFEDVVPNVGLAETFVYAPQAALGEAETRTVELNERVTLTASVGGTGNAYQWYRNDEPIAGATATTYVIDAVTADDAGTYVLQATNAGAPDLTLERAPITLNVNLPERSDERAALEAFYAATGGPSWTVRTAWLTDAPLADWHGVTVANGRVVELDLDANNLSGELPEDLEVLTALRELSLAGNALTGEIPDELDQLPDLTELDLADNQLTGGIPPELGTLSALEELSLAGNQLSGSLPDAVGALAALTSLELNANQFGGPIPAALASLTALTTLDLSENAFTDAVPDGLATLSALEELLLHGNALTDLPDLSGLGALQTLQVENNRFTFEDLEPNAGAAATFVYAPQADVGEPETRTVTPEAEVTLTASVGGTSNAYQWYRDAVAIPGATATTYVIDAATPDDAGSYTLEITNDQLPDLTLVRAPITLTVEASYPASVDLDVQVSFGDPERPTSYRLLGTAGRSRPAMTAVFSGTPGEDWVAYHDTGTDFVVYDGSATFTFGPGRGFWVLSRTPITVEQTAPTVPLQSDGTYAIPLHPGWNIISNPFDRDVPWAAVQAENGISEALWRWRGSWSQSASFASAAGGEAFYLNNTAGLDALVLPYAPADIAPRRSPEPLLTLTATDVQGATSTIQVGTAPDALAGRDRHDQAAPPGRFEPVRLRLREAATDGLLAAEYRPTADGYRLEGLLRATPGQPVRLTAAWLSPPAGQQAVLLDQATGDRIDLTTAAAWTPERPETAFTLLVGAASFVEAAVRAEVPTQLDLLPNYPNPFNPQTTLAFTLPEAATVRLAVYDLLGRRVRVLVDGARPAGRHEVVWDGRDATGEAVASGLYLYRLDADGATHTRTMTLLK